MLPTPSSPMSHVLRLSTYNLPSSYFLPRSSPHSILHLLLLLTFLLLFLPPLILQSTSTSSLWSPSFWGRDFYPLDYKSGYCEAVHPTKFMKEPVNSMSNYAFVMAGFIVASCAVEDCVRFFKCGNFDESWIERDTNLNEPLHAPANNRKPESLPLIVKQPVYSLMISLSLSYAGVSSFCFHASLTELSWKIDMASIYVMLGCYVVYGGAAVVQPFVGGGKGERAVGVIATGFLVWFAGWEQIEFPIEAKKEPFELQATSLIPIFVGVMVALISFREIFVRRFKKLPSRRRSTYLLPGLAVFLALSAFLLWNMDRKGWSCHPRSGILGHAAWHVFMSFSLLLLYLFLRAEGGEAEDREEVDDNNDKILFDL
ncbi:hypothetical protein TrST_g1468 [Triparma strigata]|uniref:Ceramidase n=1 Tax=Triparma strigata TaxID=1606541 RepID=A0A9W7ED14_9STRA|nr:hypothetical protein TrST_g1468 [Triparma strigata]